ncbi:UNVERIFIED_CONTAM: hypothetical protein PYX00_006972 [Menopon gallinae]|uniref:Methionine synthase reductase n=1 Tax=Menopon gallinae TaxID=328185 RepID=A0AAW2HH42_9NEOP
MNLITANKTEQLTYNLPDLPEEFLELTLTESKENPIFDDVCQALPLSDSELFKESRILTAKKLTYGDDVKDVYCIELPSYARHYEPGDTIGILPFNTDDDLTLLFRQLNIRHLVNQSCLITLKNSDIKIKSKPTYLNKCTTLYEIFKYHVDIRSLPKKSLIRVLVEYTIDESERTLLKEICSKEGFKKYDEEILENNKTFLDLLTNIHTCCPPVIRLLENLPALLPRPYSISSSCLSTPDRIKIVFTVAYSMTNGEKREGLCTGMLKSAVENKEYSNLPVRMFYRKPSAFRLPLNQKHPLILVGPGSGIAPFIGFLEHRKMQNSFGTIWLFYGCRYKFRDYLFKSELEDYLNCGVLTKLVVSFSRESEQDAKYVQDNINKYGKEICDMICNNNAIIYVCGDAKGLRKDVMNAFIGIIQRENGLSFKEANNFLRNLQKENRYLQDVWL